MKKVKPLLYDQHIVKRVKQYLEEHVDETYLDVKLMTRELMRKYPEYSRRKFGPFRQLVRKAFLIVSDSYGLDKASTTDEESVSEEEEEAPTNSIVNDMMNTLYNQKSTVPSKPSNEPIDISSGDENDDESPISSSNGATPAGQAIVALKRGLPSATQPQSGPAIKKKKSSKGQENISSSSNSGSSTVPTNRNPGKGNGGDSARKESMPMSHILQQQRDFSERIASMRPRKYKKEIDVVRISETFRDIGGMDSTLKELCEMLIHIKSPEFYFQLGLLPSRGILLHGPPGCGKTFLAHAIAGQLKLPLLEVPATELIGGISGESEERIRDVFEQAIDNSPCVLFIDEIDAIAANRQWASKDMERRIVSQLISSLDNLKATEFGQSVLVVAATTRPDILDPGLRRIGRFDHEIAIHIPSRKERREILRIQCEGLSIDPKLNYDKIAELTPGYVGADMLALVSRAAAIAVKRKTLKKFRELHEDSEKNMTTVTLDDDESETPAKEQATDGTEDQSVASDIIKPAKLIDKSTEEKSPAKDSENEKMDGMNLNGDKDNSNASNVVINQNEPKLDKNPDSGQHTETSSNAPDDVDEFYEPTLVELTNFLDNPPEEFSDPNFCLTFEDFVAAIKVMQPSAKREGFITVPDVTWDDIGALEDIRDELKLAVLAPVKYPEKMARLGLTAPSGVLLCGPPGCGKTLLAKAIANEAGINFISVKGPELMNMYVGESERAVRACFQRARNSAPCVIFFDEFDSLCAKRNSAAVSESSGTRIVNQLLTEMDGVEERKGVYVLAATNRPDIIDPAILRPGRLDTILYVGFPTEDQRVDILRATTKNGERPKLADDVDLKDLAKLTNGFTGADLAGLVKQAAMYALRESITSTQPEEEDLRVRNKNFLTALENIKPSVNDSERLVYEKLRLKFDARAAKSPKNIE